MLACLAAALFIPMASAQELEAKPVVAGLDGPIDFVVLPNGEIWYNEYYTGDVVRYDPDDGSKTVMFHAEPMPRHDERGLVGLAVTKETAAAGRFFVYYTVDDPDDPDGGTNRLSRIDDGEETILLTLTAAKRHNGGRILITPDDTLFVATGDNNLGAPAQDPSSLLGKILHVDQDGKPVKGNIEGAVYSMGHRNVYGLALDPATGRLFATENSNAERDEVNEIVAGGNYGWPECEGNVRYDKQRERDTDEPCDDARFIAPLGEFHPDGTVAPTGAAILHGVLYWAAWNQGEIHRLVPNDDGTWKDDVVYRSGNRINDLEAAPDSSGLYYSNWTHIMHVEMPAGDIKPLGPTDDAPGNGSSAAAWMGVLALAGALIARRRSA